MHPRLAAIPAGTARDRLKALRAIGTELKGKGISALSDDEVTLVIELKADIDRTAAKVAQLDATAEALKTFGTGEQGQPGGLTGTTPRHTAKSSSGAHEPRAEQAAAFTGAMLKAFEGHGSRLLTKSGVLPAAGTSVQFTYGEPLIASPRGPLTVSDLIAHQPTATPSGTLLVQDTRVNNAASVQVGQLKPSSTYTLVPRQWRAATIAHTTVVPRQYLADYAGLADFLGAELSFGLARTLDAAILQGCQRRLNTDPRASAES